MTSVKQDLGGDVDHVAWLLDRAFRRLRDELHGLDGRFPELRGSHHRLLSILPPDGARHSELAQRASMTKQALGQLASHLEAHGYIETLHDPQDRRARIIRATPAGREARAAGDAAIAALERRWEAEVGPRRYATFRRVLAEISAAAP